MLLREILKTGQRVGIFPSSQTFKDFIDRIDMDSRNLRTEKNIMDIKYIRVTQAP
jgi:hypothetical protein